MTKYADKTIAYVDREVGDEILDVEEVDVLPRRGQPVRVAGERFEVYDVKRVSDAKFDALVILDRR